LRPVDPADRDRSPGDPLLLVVPTPARGPAAGTRAVRWGRDPAGDDGPSRRPCRSRGRVEDAAHEDCRGQRASRCPVEHLGWSRLMSILRFEKVTREIGTFVILDEIAAAIALGDRIGLVGPNGAGKTTLLRVAAGIDEPDLGSVSRKRGLTLGLLAQEAHFDLEFMAAPDLRSAVRSAAPELLELGARLRELEHAHRVEEPQYAELQHRFDVLGGYTLDQRIDETLSGLGFTRDEWTKPPGALSGGEQTRAALARLVIADPDLMLLDEPTNHLDLGALEWLQEHP